jgi:hypothetical protein
LHSPPDPRFKAATRRINIFKFLWECVFWSLLSIEKSVMVLAVTGRGSVFLVVALSVYANILADLFHQFIQAAASFGPIHFFQRLIQGMR